MLDADRIEALLSRSLDDSLLSRGERRALEGLLDDDAADDAALALWRNRAFALARRAMADGRGPEVLDWLEEVAKLLAHRAASSRADDPNRQRSCIGSRRHLIQHVRP